jgi:hypothetical protein
VYSPALTDLNLDEAGQPLSISSAIREPHGKEWTLADEQELIKLLVILKCLLPVMRPSKNPTYLKRMVKEKWDEVHRLRKRPLSPNSVCYLFSVTLTASLSFIAMS